MPRLLGETKVHVVQVVDLAREAPFALCCDASVRPLDFDKSLQHFTLINASGECGPGCAWVKAAEAKEAVERQKAILVAMQAAQATSEKSNEIAAANRDTLKGAVSPHVDLLDAYRHVCAFGDDVLRRRLAANVDSADGMDEAVTTWYKKFMDSEDHG